MLSCNIQGHLKVSPKPTKYQLSYINSLSLRRISVERKRKFLGKPAGLKLVSLLLQDSKKWKMAARMFLVSEDYLEMLRKYGGKDNQDTASLSDENCPAGKAADAKIIESLPVSHRNAGTLLLSFFKDNGISYDEAHQIVINGDPIPSSHAQDLVHDLLRFRKSVTPPTGFEELAQA